MNDREGIIALISAEEIKPIDYSFRSLSRVLSMTVPPPMEEFSYTYSGIQG
jgi:hypothetical protein